MIFLNISLENKKCINYYTNKKLILSKKVELRRTYLHCSILKPDNENVTNHLN